MQINRISPVIFQANKRNNVKNNTQTQRTVTDERLKADAAELVEELLEPYDVTVTEDGVIFKNEAEMKAAEEKIKKIREVISAYRQLLQNISSRK